MPLPKNFEISLHKGSFPEGFKVIRSALTAYNKKTLGLKRKTAFMSASVGGKIIGGVDFYWYGESAVIDIISLEKKWQRNGIGQKLMDAVERKLIRQGCRQVHLGTLTSQAPSFYRKQGYKYVANIPHFLGKKDLLYFRKFLKTAKAK